MKNKSYIAFLFCLGFICFWSLNVELRDTVAQRKVSQVYKEYHPYSLEKAKTPYKLLYFNASWCASCRQLEESILNNLAKVPQDMSIYKIDFDNESELKNHYQAKVQSTLILLDAQDQPIKRWVGNQDILEILKEFQGA